MSCLWARHTSCSWRWWRPVVKVPNDMNAGAAEHWRIPYLWSAHHRCVRTIWRADRHLQFCGMKSKHLVCDELTLNFETCSEPTELWKIKVHHMHIRKPRRHKRHCFAPLMTWNVFATFYCICPLALPSFEVVLDWGEGGSFFKHL